MIRARALKLCSGRFKNFDDAQAYQILESQELERLINQTEKLLSIGRIEGSGF